MKNFIALIVFLTSIHSVRGSVLSDFLSDLRDKVAPVSIAGIMDEGFKSMIARNTAVDFFRDRIGGRCHLKNAFPDPRGPISEDDIAHHNREHLLFWGDSMTDWIDRLPMMVDDPMTGGRNQVDVPIDPRIYYGDNWNKIKKTAIGGTTAEDLKDHMNRAGGYDPFKFFPNPISDTHINLENRYGVILYGGNDILRYENTLRALPWLMPFRMGAIINSLNRITTYHQAQGSQVLLISHTPRPAVPNFNFFGDLGVIGEYLNTIIKFQGGAALNSVEFLKQAYANVYDCIKAKQCSHSQTLLEIAVLSAYSGAKQREAEIALAQLFNFPGSNRTDQTWLSQQLGQLNLLTINLVVHNRRAEYLDEWFHFSDLPSVAMGRWWVGNPVLYEGDGIHFSHPFGHLLHAQNVTEKLNQLGWWTNPTPVQGDRCNFTVNATFQEGQPAIWTPEPEPLPEANEDAMLLIIACIIFGYCSI